MSLKLTDLIKDRSLIEGLVHGPICGICDKEITDKHPDEMRIHDGKPVHDDCYFEKLGAHIEKHPIHTPGVRRG